MKRIHASLAVLSLVVWSAAVSSQTMNTLTAREKAQGWQLLFDGKTMAEWHISAPAQGQGRALTPPPAQPGAVAQVGSTPKPCVAGAKGSASAAPAGSSHWEVVDGLLMPCGEPTGYLTSDQTYRNFVLSIEFKCGEDTNSGVFVHRRKAAATRSRFGDSSRLATTPERSSAPQRPLGTTGSSRTSGISIRSRLTGSHFRRAEWRDDA